MGTRPIFSWKCALLPGIASVACLQFEIGRCEREVRISDKDGDSKGLKITFVFTRRYLANRIGINKKAS